jgi:hypothetical protein
MTTHLMPLTKISLHIIPTFDYGRNGVVPCRRVEPWDKSAKSVEKLLDDIVSIWPVMEKLEARGLTI